MGPDRFGHRLQRSAEGCRIKLWNHDAASEGAEISADGGRALVGGLDLRQLGKVRTLEDVPANLFGALARGCGVGGARVLVEHSRDDGGSRGYGELVPVLPVVRGDFRFRDLDLVVTETRGRIQGQVADFDLFVLVPVG